MKNGIFVNGTNFKSANKAINSINYLFHNEFDTVRERLIWLAKRKYKKKIIGVRKKQEERRYEFPVIVFRDGTEEELDFKSILRDLEAESKNGNKTIRNEKWLKTKLPDKKCKKIKKATQFHWENKTEKKDVCMACYRYKHRNHYIKTRENSKKGFFSKIKEIIKIINE